MEPRPTVDSNGCSWFTMKDGLIAPERTSGVMRLRVFLASGDPALGEETGDSIPRAGGDCEDPARGSSVGGLLVADSGESGRSPLDCILSGARTAKVGVWPTQRSRRRVETG